MEIEKLSPPYEVELHREEGRLVEVVIRAVGGDGKLSYDELREATRSILDRVRRDSVPMMQIRAGLPSKAAAKLITEYKAGEGTITDRYLSALSVAYEELAPQGRAVSVRLAAALGIPTATLKGHLVRAREDGFLTRAVPGREGGEATDKARKILSDT